ncbi:asparagine synthase-related protein [Kordia sp.]|uniref:asparagine synthase C-terminal domain-containing protein n=1 Tax=Kordia sp. TaxID=1965332 RepID=UPI003D6BB15D
MNTNIPFFLNISPKKIEQYQNTIKIWITGKIRFNSNFTTQENVENIYKTKGLSYLLERSEGDFALCIIDGYTKKMHLITDAFSTQPIYFFWDETNMDFSCANTIRAITQQHRNALHLDWDQLLYKRKSSASSNTFPTIVDGISRIQGSRIGTLDFSKKTWTITSYQRENCIDDEVGATYTASDFITSYREIIEQAVFKRIEGHSEVTVTLSGGFDSSIVYALAAKKTNVRAASICTTTSLQNEEIDRARELTLREGSDHLIFPVGFTDKPSIEEWIKLVLSKETINCGFEDLVKSQLMQQMHATYGSSQYVLSGMGSDQFNGGTTTLDYSDEDENGSWEAFMNNMLRKKWKDYRASTFNDFFQFSYHFSTMNFREKLWPFGDDEWTNYLNKNQKSLQRRGVFLETKLSQANGFLIGFPFLDTTSIELIKKIPDTLKGELLYDKQILRAAFKDLLPASFQGKPKFYRTSNVEEKVFNYLKNVIYHDKYALLKIAFDSSPGLQERFTLDKIIAFLDQTKSSSYFPSYTYILELINIGLLEGYFFEGKSFEFKKPNQKTIVYDAHDKKFDREALESHIF